jgi:WD40 repeat protein
MRTGLLVLVALAIGPVTAAPLPKDTRPVITVESVARLAPVGEVAGDFWRVVWGPEGGQVTLLAWSRGPVVLDAQTLKPAGKGVTDKSAIHMAITRDRGHVAWCENDTRVAVHDLKAATTMTIETGTSQPDMVFSPDGKLLVTGGYATQAHIWEVVSGKLIRAVDAGAEGGLTPVFSPDGTVLAVGNRNDTTRLYEVATGKLLHVLDKATTQGLKFRPDGKQLAVGYVDGSVGLWDVAAGKLERSAPAAVKEVYEVDWTPKGDVLVTAGREGKIVLWDPKELKPIRELDAPEWVIQARFSPDGRRLWTAGGRMEAGPERKVVVWGLPDR